ncbi:hypothetical protein PanWU01x14_033530 [Parasponia andersonii]|uniref:Uncharacterized protein n=1 Tax=Parasponia andersonii TaxID=3476 RepID=A0A2P5DTU6_PARAD|nr:hypothetical protein PanWU01x14_033530 [Parasponia andersonii]
MGGWVPTTELHGNWAKVEGGRVKRTWCTCARKPGAPPKHDRHGHIGCAHHSATLRTALAASRLNVAICSNPQNMGIVVLVAGGVSHTYVAYKYPSMGTVEDTEIKRLV